MSSLAHCYPHDDPNYQQSFRLYTNAAIGLRANSTLSSTVGTRRKRKFTPEEHKDSNYWLKRSRNNESAKRSRQRKRMEEYILQARAVELLRENEQLKVALSAFQHRTGDVSATHYGIVKPSLSTECSSINSLKNCSAPFTTSTSSFGKATSTKSLAPKTLSDQLRTVYMPSACQANTLNSVSCGPSNVFFSGTDSSPTAAHGTQLLNDRQILNDVCSHNFSISNFGVSASNDDIFATNAFLTPIRHDAMQRYGTLCYQHQRESVPYSNDFDSATTPEKAPILTTQARTTGWATESTTSPAGMFTYNGDTEPGSLFTVEIGTEQQSVIAKTSDCGTLVLPYKLRYKVSRTLRGDHSGTTSSTTSENTLVHENTLKAPLLSKGVVQHMNISKTVRPGAQSSISLSKENDSPSSDSTTRLSPQDAAKDVCENGYLRNQFATLHSELKNLTQIILRKSPY